MKRMVLRLASITYAMKVSRILKRNNIMARVVKMSDIGVNTGCGYGIEIFEKDLYTVAAILRQEGLEYSVYDDNK